jgi:hypothetical protein
LTEKHLYEFTEGGFYAAASKDDALRLYCADLGDEDRGLALDDFRREVPDDELIDVCGESTDDKWDDPREYQQALTRKGVPDPKRVHWFLKVTAREWANELTHGEGHVFGGDHY